MTAFDEIDDRFAIPVGEVLSYPLSILCVCGHPPHDDFCPVCGCSIYEPDNGRPSAPGAVQSHRTNERYDGRYGTEKGFRL